MPTLLIALLPLAGCSESPTADRAARTAETPPEVALTLVSVEPGRRFPKSFWTFDVRLANRSPEARWLLIPDPPEKALELERAADAVAVVALAPSGVVRMLRISATHGLVALRLGPAAEVTLRNLRLTSWDERPLGSVEVWAARQLWIDGEPLGEEWLGVPGLLVTGSVTADAAVEEEVGGWSDPELRGHPLAYPPDERWTLAVVNGRLRLPEDRGDQAAAVGKPD